LRQYGHWLPLVPALVYCVGLIANFGAILRAVYSSADASSVLYIAQSFPSAPHGARIVYGDVQILQVLAVLLATRVLPAYRYVWEVLPWVASLAAIWIVARVVRTVAGRWAATMIMITLGCAGPFLLGLQFEWGIHTAAYQDICVFGAVPALLALRGGTLGHSRRAWYVWLLIVVLVGAGGVANDNLFVIGGLLPFAIAGAVTAWLAAETVRKHVLYSIGVVVVGTVVLGEIALVVARHADITSVPFHLEFAQYDQILDHGGLLAQSLLYLLNGNFGGLTVNLTGAVAFAGAIVVVGAVYTAYSYGRRQIGPLVVSPLRASIPHRSPRVREPVELARLALTVYWVTSAVVLSVAFVFTSAVVDVDSMRYAVTVAYAVIVLAAVASAPHPWARYLIAIGACVLVCGACITIFRHDLEASDKSFPKPAVADALEKWVHAEHLRYGYASYWDAAPLDWWSRSRLSIAPVQVCADAATLCAYDNRISSWYTPHPHARSFVVVDNRFLRENAGAALGVGGPSTAFGRPARVAHVADLTVYVYQYDVASRFGPPALF
jgi:hypothetical protein